MAQNAKISTEKIVEYINFVVGSKGISDFDKQVFIDTAIAHNLNPFLKEIYLVPSKDGQYTTLVSYNLYIETAHHTGLFGGNQFIEHLNQKGELEAVTARVYRKDCKNPFEWTAKMKEFNKNNFIWKDKPSAMLTKVAFKNALAIAFGLKLPYIMEEINLFQETFENHTSNEKKPLKEKRNLLTLKENLKNYSLKIDLRNDAIGIIGNTMQSAQFLKDCGFVYHEGKGWEMSVSDFEVASLECFKILNQLDENQIHYDFKEFKSKYCIKIIESEYQKNKELLDRLKFFKPNNKDFYYLEVV